MKRKRKRNQTVNVTIRFRVLNTGKETLYLDYYPAVTDPETGKPSRREYLGLYVNPLRDKKGNPKPEKRAMYLNDKNVKYRHEYHPQDYETIRTAEIIRNNRKNELDKAEIYTEHEAEMLKAKERGKGDFIQYFKHLSDDNKQSNRDNWTAALGHLKAYTQKTDNADTIRFCDITLQWCEGFKNYLLTVETRGNKALATNTAAAYFVKFKIVLKSAYRYGYLSKDINRDLKSIKEIETHREFLTLPELNTLVNTPYANGLIKRAALFSALTGLRHSDIIKMKWGEIQETDGQFTLKYVIQKTNRYQELPISTQAVQLCGERKEPDKPVFEGLQYSAYANKALAQWIGAAGITRNITFHCFRHTFATLQLASGTQITTIQKMLGHKDLQTTLVYAKTLEEAKREAAEKIKLNL